MPRFLYPLSLVYGALAALDRAATASRRLPKPVISIGNLTWGGTGKTPTVIALARQLAGQGVKPVVLSRGYFRKSKETVIVSDGAKILVPPKVSGDEPYLIAAAAPGTGVMAGADRYGAGMLALQTLRPDVFILDDGFQHWKLERSLDIVCINALNPFGNGFLLPAGILREPVEALRRAQCVVITNTDGVSEEALEKIENRIAPFISSAAVVRARYAVSGMRRLSDGTVFSPGTFAGKEAVLLSAVGENKGFRRTAEKAGLRVAGHLALRDHYWYNINEVKLFLSRFPENLPLFTTAKDAVRLVDVLSLLPDGDRERFYSLDIDLEITSGEEQWRQRIEKVLRSS